jgi:hypothetical protein
VIVAKAAIEAPAANEDVCQIGRRKTATHWLRILSGKSSDEGAQLIDWYEF